MASAFRSADLILNRDGSVYHLRLLPEMLAEDVILVGDPGRVKKISGLFSKVDVRVAAREFITHTGWFSGKRISVVSTGIGTDNVDIVLNELDALANMELAARKPMRTKRSLRFIRVGTSGALQPDIPVGSLLVSTAALGLDSLGHFYPHRMTIRQQQLCASLQAAVGLSIRPYLATGDRGLIDRFGEGMHSGITLTAPGFYQPQGRPLRHASRYPMLLEHLTGFRAGTDRLTNMEMETAGLYMLSKVMGHHAVSLNAVLANRVTGEFCAQPEKVVEKLIRTALERI